MTKRNGISLVNVMVFMLFAAMVTAQVFFFMSSSMDSIGEEREIMMYRLRLDTLVEEAREKLKATALSKNNPSATYETFYANTKTSWQPENNEKWEEYNCHVAIHDLNYKFDSSLAVERNGKWKEQSGSKMYKKVFAAMPPDKKPELDEDNNPVRDEDGKIKYTDDIQNRYYLIRAYADLPQKFYGQHLMYQVLVRRNEDNNEVDTLSFQEVWF